LIGKIAAGFPEHYWGHGAKIIPTAPNVCSRKTDFYRERKDVPAEKLLCVDPDGGHQPPWVDLCIDVLLEKRRDTWPRIVARIRPFSMPIADAIGSD
jgi:hypothetical protein